MTKKEWQQYSFLSPVHVDIGIVKPLPKHRRRPRQTNPDVTAALAFRQQKRAVIYTGGPEPDFNRLTPHQQQIYQAIAGGERLKTAAWLEQQEAERQGLTHETFYLDQAVQLTEEEHCGDCTSILQRYVVIQKPGRGAKAGQAQLLVNDYCPDCGAINEDYKVWVSNDQIIRKE